jgi:multicomponent Na+:H+ antiporter subunit F
MQLALVCVMLLLLLSLIAGLLRVTLGPTVADGMIAGQLVGTTGVAILLVMSFALNSPALIDGALVFALLTAVPAVALIRPYVPREREEGE